jgi:hypothetical protein
MIRKIDEEIKGVKKNLGQDAGTISTRLKHQIIAVNGEYSTKAVRDFIDDGYLLAMDSIELRKYIASITPDVIMKKITLSDGDLIDSRPTYDRGIFFSRERTIGLHS